MVHHCEICDYQFDDSDNNNALQERRSSNGNFSNRPKVSDVFGKTRKSAFIV